MSDREVTKENAQVAEATFRPGDKVRIVDIDGGRTDEPAVVIEVIPATATSKEFAWLAVSRGYNYEENSGPWWEIDAFTTEQLERAEPHKSVVL